MRLYIKLLFMSCYVANSNEKGQQMRLYIAKMKPYGLRFCSIHGPATIDTKLELPFQHIFHFIQFASLYYIGIQKLAWMGETESSFLLYMHNAG